MRDLKELHAKRTKLHHVFGANHVQTRFFEQSVLFELAAYQFDGEAASVYRNVQIGKDERNGADMVLVSVSKEDGFDFAFVLEQKPNVRNDHIDAEKFFVGKHDSGVNDNDRSVTSE